MNEYFAVHKATRVGVLGTRAVMASKLYGVNTVDVIIPPADDIAGVHSAYVALAAVGVATLEQCAYFHDAARKLHAEGADLIVLGGTDLSIAFKDADLEFPIVDSAIIHVEAIARAAMRRNDEWSSEL